MRQSATGLCPSGISGPGAVSNMEVADMAGNTDKPDGKPSLCLTVDVEDWYHILQSPAVPSIVHWSGLESRIERNLDKLLKLLDSASGKCTLFWLGWVAERHKEMVRKCWAAGHEIACHGYAHVLAHEVGRQAFWEDITRAKAVLEDIIGEPVRGFRAPGFCIANETAWAFDMIKEAGYHYDTSVFPASRSYGGMPGTILGPHFIETHNGHLLEIPVSVVQVFGWKACLFGGGYLRLATKPMIRWGLDKLKAIGRPPVVYVHPREIDPYHPRLPLSAAKRFRCYTRLKSTLSKLEWLCRDYQLRSVLETVESYIKSFYFEAKTLPVLSLADGHRLDPPDLWLAGGAPTSLPTNQSYRARLLEVERMMSTFIGSGDPTPPIRMADLADPTTVEEPHIRTAHSLILDDATR